LSIFDHCLSSNVEICCLLVIVEVVGGVALEGIIRIIVVVVVVVIIALERVVGDVGDVGVIIALGLEKIAFVGINPVRHESVGRSKGRIISLRKREEVLGRVEERRAIVWVKCIITERR